MKFLIEKNIATAKEEDSLRTGSYKEKMRKAYKIIDEQPNSKYLQIAKPVYANSIVENGTDTNTNPFLRFVTNIRKDIPGNVANLIKSLVDNGSLSPDEDWLYDKKVYSGENEDILLRLKALTYASNKRLQSGADKEIVVKDIKNERGEYLPTTKLKKLLKSINISKSNRIYTGDELLSLQNVVADTKDKSLINYVAKVIDRPVGNVELMFEDNSIISYMEELFDKKYRSLEDLNKDIKTAFGSNFEKRK